MGRRRPKRAAGLAASRAAARLSAQEEAGQGCEEDFANQRDETLGEGQESSVMANTPSRKRRAVTSIARRPRASRSRKPADDSQARHPRPPGRAPAGKHWDSASGQWASTTGTSIEPLAATASARSDMHAASSTSAGHGEDPQGASSTGANSSMYPLVIPPEDTRIGASSRWEVAGADLPGWMVERRVAATGRQYAVYHGPQGLRATSRAQALAGGVRRGTLQKPMEEMTVRELICERTQGVPMRAARIVRMRRRKTLETAATVADPPGAQQTTGTSGGPTWSDFSLGGGAGRSFVMTDDVNITEALRRQREAEQEESLGPQLADCSACNATDGPRDHDDAHAGSDDNWIADACSENGGNNDESEGGDEEEAVEDCADHESDSDGRFIPQLRIVNGQIVLDEASLHVSAQPAAPRLAPTIEEDSGGGVTSASYLNRAPSLPWSPTETEAFLAALQKCATYCAATCPASSIHVHKIT